MKNLREDEPPVIWPHIPTRSHETSRRLLLAAVGRLNYERIFYTRHVGHIPHIINPRTFSEKIVWRKLYEDIPLAKLVCDKLAVRSLVSNVVGEKYLNRLLTTTKIPSELDITKLPEGFAAKANHGSKQNVIVRDKTKVDPAILSASLSRCLETDFGYTTNERWYLEVEREILVERLLHDRDFGLPLDYNFFVFHGAVEMICANFDRFGSHMQSFFDPNWNLLDLKEEFPIGPPLAAPAKLDEMKEVAAALAAGFDFVRVDLYCVNNQDVVFGEITLTPGAGWLRYRPREVDSHLGALWDTPHQTKY